MMETQLKTTRELVAVNTWNLLLSGCSVLHGQIIFACSGQTNAFFSQNHSWCRLIYATTQYFQRPFIASPFDDPETHLFAGKQWPPRSSPSDHRGARVPAGRAVGPSPTGCRSTARCLAGRRVGEISDVDSRQRRPPGLAPAPSLGQQLMRSIDYCWCWCCCRRWSNEKICITPSNVQHVGSIICC